MMFPIILQVLLGVGLLLFGSQKFTTETMKKSFEHFGYGDGFRMFTGLFEILSGLVVLIGVWIKPLAVIGGGTMVVVTMIGALYTHIKIKDEVKNMLMPFILFLIGGVVAVLNWTQLF